MDKKPVDKTKIRYDQQVNACQELGLIDSQMKEDLIRLYEYRTTVHLEVELKKGLRRTLSQIRRNFSRNPQPYIRLWISAISHFTGNPWHDRFLCR
jgi:hypothetical protein